ncbi:PPE domain-containing protein [Mycolicibacterium sp.]|uniref:PPE domain-containing protein n=1 Tax=Mycolicibacterium sp. TaxID=2320850 RepID=UPI00355EBCD7
MPNHPWGASTPEMNAGVLETGSTSATWAAASAAWMGLASATLATMGIVGGQMAASLTSISGMRSATAAAATPPFLSWLGSLAGIAFKQAAITAVVAESYGMARSSMIPSMQAINNRVREAAAEASNIFGQNTPLIAALNAEYGAYTTQNASIGSTYGQVITAATIPVPIPPPPPLGNAAKTGADAASALSEAAQNVASAGGGQASKAASQAASGVGQGASSPTDAMGQMSSLFQAPMQAAQSGMQSLSSFPQSFQQLLSAPMSMFGSMSGLGDMLGGGSTGPSFSPALTGSGGLPLGGGSPASLGGGGVGMGGGIGAPGGGLLSRADGASNSRSSVLSGVSTSSPAQERMAGTTMGGGPGGAVPPGMAGAGAGGSRSRSGEVSVVSYGAGDKDSTRRGAAGSERDLFN